MTHMFLRYSLLAVLQLFLMVTQLCFSWLIAAFIDKQGHLPIFLKWFEPTDSLATGDQMYWDREMLFTKYYPERWQRYVRGFFWGMRNPAYGFADRAGYTIQNASKFTTTRPVTSDNDIDIGDNGANFGSVYRTITNGDGKKYFEYRKVAKWNEKYAWFIQLGWTVPATTLVEGDRQHLCVYIRPRVLIIK